MTTQRVYIGTYTGKGSEGVYLAEFDDATGELSAPRLAAACENPSFVAMHPSGRFLYATCEMYQPGGWVAAFEIDRASGGLRPLNRVASGGAGPCHVSVHPSGRVALAANYGGGSVAAIPIRDDGTLGEPGSVVQHAGSGPDPQRQTRPHAHCVVPDPWGRFVLVADLGMDRVLVYRLDVERATLTPHDPASVPATVPGAGPRLIAFAPDGRRCYVMNEMGVNVGVYAWDADAGRLTPMLTASTLPPGYDGRRSGAHVAAHPNGRFLYASNRGHDSIAAFAIAGDGTLAPLGHTPAGGAEPRHFAIDATGRWLLVAHQNSGTIAAFRVDPHAAALERVGGETRLSSPVCLCLA